MTARTTVSLRREVCLMTVAIAVYLTIVVGEIGGRTFVGDMDNVAETVAALVAATACFLAATRAGRDTRLSWWLLGASSLSWGLGQAAWTYYESIVHDAPFPSVADLGYLLAIPLAGAALLAFPSGQYRSGRIRSIIDGLTIACACFGVSWVLVLGRVAETSGEGLELGLAMAYPLGDVVLLVVTLSVMARAADAHRAAVVAIAVAMGLLALADSAFAYLTTTGSDTTNLFNAGWVAGYLVLALAARHARRGGMTRPEARAQPYWVLLLPYAPMVAFVLLAIPVQLRDGHLSTIFTVVGVPLVLLLLVRQTFVHRDNLALTDRLEQQITALASSRESLRHQALHDPLTGLPNRSHLMRELAARFDGTLPPQSALLLMDLDRFKEINDGLGHDVGDRVLTEVAGRLHTATPAGDTVVRLGGDEFALLLDDPPGEERPEAVATLLLESLQRAVEVDGLTLSVGVSIGICHSNEATDATTMLQSADVAMYRAKRQGRSIAVYGAEDAEDRPTRLVLLNDMRTMLDSGDLTVHYQPQVDLTSGAVVGMEALARWHHPVNGWIPPDQFIPFAEQTGLIGELTSQVLREALAQCARWRSGGLDLTMSVNLSPKGLQDDSLAPTLHEIILGARLPARYVTLEITESAFAGNTDSLVATLDRLRSLGVRLSIDDFGTGYSSMSHLKRLPVHELKIDRCFITDIAFDEDDQAIVTSIVGLARTLGLSVVAEGVEDGPSLTLVAQLGCDSSQGYHLCRPGDAATITEWLATHQGLRDLADATGIAGASAVRAPGAQ